MFKHSIDKRKREPSLKPASTSGLPLLSPPCHSQTVQRVVCTAVSTPTSFSFLCPVLSAAPHHAAQTALPRSAVTPRRPAHRALLQSLTYRHLSGLQRCTPHSPKPALSWVLGPHCALLSPDQRCHLCLAGPRAPQSQQFKPRLLLLPQTTHPAVLTAQRIALSLLLKPNPGHSPHLPLPPRPRPHPSLCPGNLT